MTGIPDELVEKAAQAMCTDAAHVHHGRAATIHCGWHMEQSTAALEAIGLPALLERVEAAEPDWSNCVHGVKGGCRSFRCGSNCGQTYDRMHPCLACVTDDMVRYRDERDALAAKVADAGERIAQIEALADEWERVATTDDPAHFTMRACAGSIRHLLNGDARTALTEGTEET